MRQHFYDRVSNFWKPDFLAFHAKDCIVVDVTPEMRCCRKKLATTRIFFREREREKERRCRLCDSRNDANAFFERIACAWLYLRAVFIRRSCEFFLCARDITAQFCKRSLLNIICKVVFFIVRILYEIILRGSEEKRYK